MASVKELLKKSLDELVEDELKEFQWLLRNDHECISKSKMENADRLKTVDTIVDCFGPEEAVKITVEILRKINQNNLAEKIINKQDQTDGTIKSPAPFGLDLKSIPVNFSNIVPRTRNDFLQYSHQLNLDLNTVNKYLLLSEKNRVITYTLKNQSYPDHPERFDYFDQVLCRESVSDRRCYWEIEWSGDVCLSVSYKSISRKGKGDDCVFGSNDQSWSLSCSSSCYSFRHNDIVTSIPLVESISSSRIGVYVDHSAGTLSFYSVSGDTMILIHTVQTTFTQPLYPGFTVGIESSVKLCDESV